MFFSMLLTISTNKLEKTSDWLLIEISMLLTIYKGHTAYPKPYFFKVILGFRI